MLDSKWVCTQPEGQFLERKTCFDYSTGRKRRRPVKDVATDVAEALCAMANADGGVVVLGIDDDGTPTGIPAYPADRLQVIYDAPRRLVRPELSPSVAWEDVSGVRVLIFEVDWSPEVHWLSDGRYMMRIGDKNMPFPAEDIEAIKTGKRRRYAESRIIPDAGPGDLELDLLDELGRRTGLSRSPEDILTRYRLADKRGPRLVLNLAALLLFAQDPIRWYDNCRVDIVRWEGTERRFGRDLNVIKRHRVEGPIPRLIQEAFDTVENLLPKRQPRGDLFFEDRWEYPPFAWQEAIVNAVAHRDYALEGTPIEIWVFDDRLEVRSPGVPVEPVTVERLQQREPVHASRNPRLVRVLTDLGHMRELGEGIPRMFEVMEEEGLQEPQFALEAGSIFVVTLRNTPVYDSETMGWLRQYASLDLSPRQRRLLAYAHGHGDQFTSRQFQRLTGADIYTASREIKDLIRKGVVQLERKRGRVYRVLPPREHGRPIPHALRKLLPVLLQKGYVKNADVRRLLGMETWQAGRQLKEWVTAGWLRPEGEKRGRRYYLTQDIVHSE